MKFLCDQMFGTLANWLRLLGFDTYYANSEIDDDKLLEIAKNEDRVLITRDKELSFRAKRDNMQVFKPESIHLDEQLVFILKNVDLNEEMFLSRCSLCNNLLNEIGKDDVKKMVPEKVFENNNKFWFCSNCKKVYWKGSHYDKILSRINKIKKS